LKLGQYLERYRLGRWLLAMWRAFARSVIAMQLPMPTPEECLRRITLMERDIMLPIKAVGVPLLIYLGYHGHWVDNVAKALDVEVNLSSSQYFVWVYLVFFWSYV